MNRYVNKFQSTHPHGVRQAYIQEVTLRELFQSTHPHGVRHYQYTVRTDIINISIHAPTWGATSPKPFFYITFKISIHAPTWGATRTCQDLAKTRSFQSTHPHGVRLGSEMKLVSAEFISIHAPTWGATRFLDADRTSNTFQSTHPHGVRLSGYTLKE